jgi:hypothetical protein
VSVCAWHTYVHVAMWVHVCDWCNIYICVCVSVCTGELRLNLDSVTEERNGLKQVGSGSWVMVVHQFIYIHIYTHSLSHTHAHTHTQEVNSLRASQEEMGDLANRLRLLSGLQSSVEADKKKTEAVHEERVMGLQVCVCVCV